MSWPNIPCTLSCIFFFFCLKRDLIEIRQTWSTDVPTIRLCCQKCEYIVPGFLVLFRFGRFAGHIYPKSPPSVVACSLHCICLSEITALRNRRELFLTGFARSNKYLKRYTQALSITKITHIKRTQEVKYFRGSRILFPFLEQ